MHKAKQRSGRALRFFCVVGAIIANLAFIAGLVRFVEFISVLQEFRWKGETNEPGLSLIQICVAFTILCTLGCEKLRDGIKSSPGDGTVNSTISISRDDASPNEVNTGSVVITDAAGYWGTDDYDLRAAAITDDTLRLTVSYSGGCEPHEFTLVTSGAFLESSPVQLAISVAHNANDDPCEAYPTENYHFDLTGIKALYQAAYQQEAGTIILLLEDSPNGQLAYQFAM